MVYMIRYNNIIGYNIKLLKYQINELKYLEKYIVIFILFLTIFLNSL